MEGDLQRPDDPWLIGGSLPPVTVPLDVATHGLAAPSLEETAQPTAWPAKGSAWNPPDWMDDDLSAALDAVDPDIQLGFQPVVVRRYVRQRFRAQALVFLAFMAVGGVFGYATGPHNATQVFASSPPSTIASGVPFTVTAIWLHNVLLVALPIAAFPLLFWAPVVSVFMTGFVVGKLAAVWLALHLSGGSLFAALAPHGIIEIPATLVGAVLAWRMGMAVWDRRIGGTWLERAREAALAAIPVVVLVVLSLLVAAYIEVHVTPWLVLLSLGN